jgi:hypothetical protein
VAIFAGFIEFGKKAETCARQSQGEAAQLSGQYRLIYVGAKRAQRKRLAQNLWLSRKKPVRDRNAAQPLRVDNQAFVDAHTGKMRTIMTASRRRQRGERIDAFNPPAVSLARGEPWSQEDLFSSAQLLSVGVPIDHVAAYLKRTVAEVEGDNGVVLAD